ncbi:hypothetical protein [Sphingomonas humi]
MDSALLLRALTLLSEALELVDQAQAPGDIGARLNTLIDRVRDIIS